MCYSVEKDTNRKDFPRTDSDLVPRDARILAVSGVENRGPIPTRSAIQNEGNEDGTNDLLDTMKIDEQRDRQLKR